MQNRERAKLVSRTPSLDGRSIYPLLGLHQCNEEWQWREDMNLLHKWAVRFNVLFKLDVPRITLCLDALPARVGGYFRYGHNGFGLKGEIAVNANYLGLPAWWVLGVLLHEVLHAWQDAHGKPGRNNYHNKEYRDKARSLGLVVDTQGHQEFDKESPFFDLLREHGVDVPEFKPQGDERPEDDDPVELVERQRPKGNSKVKKWSCGCTNVRVAVAHFSARCLRCGGVFIKA